MISTLAAPPERSVTRPATASPTHRLTGSPAFRFRTYQREDLARAALHDGAILAWDPGLGKTMAIFAWPFLKRARHTLIVAPASLHAQIIKEGRDKFGVTVVPIKDQDAALDLMRRGLIPRPSGRVVTASHAFDFSGFDPATRALLDALVKLPSLETFNALRNRIIGTGLPHKLHYDRETNELTKGELDDTARPLTLWQACGAVSPDFPVREPEIMGHHITDDVIRMALHHVGLAAQVNPVNDVNPVTHALPRFFITDYRWLGYNGADEVLESNSVQIEARIPLVARYLNLHPSELPDWFFAEEQPLEEELPKILKALPFKIQVAYPFVREAIAGIGVTRGYVLDDGTTHDITCCFTPSLASIIGDSFDAAVCDEAVRIKSGTESYIARGILRLTSTYRLALTGTPIKNRLPDIFFLAAWVCGLKPGGSPRFPYGCTQSHKSGFANNHLVIEENLTKTEQSKREGSGRRFVKQINKLTNVHRLWKLLGPVVVRRRKDDIGEDLVKKNIRPVKVMPGTEQLATYEWHLDNPPECATKVASLGAQLQYLRQAALCPWTSCLPNVRSASRWSPKMAAILHLAADLMEKGEQLVVFSPFQDFSTALQSHFREAGVDSILLDGRVNNVKRGDLAADFKARKHPVLIAGIASMGEGHSFECASNLVLPSLSWAYDENAQAIERVHRLMSRKDVTIYTLVTSNTIDERLAQLFDEKGDASDLALDGRLFEDDREEVSLEELLHSARMTFSSSAATLDESELAAEWCSVLRPRLTLAATAFKAAGGSAESTAPPAVSPITDKPTDRPTGPPSNLIEFPGLFEPAPVPALAPAAAAATVAARSAPVLAKGDAIARLAAAFA